MIRCALIAALSLGACAEPATDAGVEVDLGLPAHFPDPVVPATNPLTASKIELGRHLFYDARLSVNETISCSTCHQQQLAFAATDAVSLGATGDVGVLNAPTLTNAIYASPLTWAHGDIDAIEDQLLGPMFGEAPLEMGMTGNEAVIVDRLRSDALYPALFAEAFGGEAPVDLDNARLALASFVRSLVSYESPFDGFLAGDAAALSDGAKRGSELFYSPRLGCGACHVGFALTSATHSAASAGRQLTPFHNIGLYNLGPDGDYPETAQGLIEQTGVARDMGRFRVPTLRNVELTAPYMHDGSVATLEDVIAIYEAGGRNVEDGPFAGDGRDNPHRSEDLRSFELTDAERDDLLAFLGSLTDEAFVTDPRHADPWR